MAPSRAKEIYLSDFLLQTKTTLKNHFDLARQTATISQREREREGEVSNNNMFKSMISYCKRASSICHTSN